MAKKKVETDTQPKEADNQTPVEDENKVFPTLEEVVKNICRSDLIIYASGQYKFTLTELTEHFQSLGYTIINL